MFDDDPKTPTRDFFTSFTNSKAIGVIVVIGLIVFFNSLSNPFILDDNVQILNNASINSLSNIPLYFLRGEIFSDIPSVNILQMHYKPLFYSAYSLIYFFSGDNPALFHLVQLTIYIANSILIFFIFSRFLNKALSLILSLILLVHPINSEVAIYIADLQDVIFVLFGLLAFYITIKIKHPITYRYIFLLSFLLLSSLLSKETGILFLIICLFYSWLFSRKSLKLVTVGVSISLISYISLRYLASLSPLSTIILPSVIQSAPIFNVLLTVPKILLYYLSNFLYPVNLAVGQEWIVRQISFQDFYFPILLDTLAIFAFVICGTFLYRNKRNLLKQFIFFSLWFWLGMIIHLQIIQLDFTVADRWFYFPIIGLAGAMGTVITSFKYEGNKRNLKSILVAIFIFLILILSILTIIRNSQWQTPLKLYAHDAKYAESPEIYTYYGGLLIHEGRHDEAKLYLEKSISLDPYLGSNINNLAKLYVYKKDFAKAKELYRRNIRSNKRKLSHKDISYIGLAQIELFIDKDAQEAKKFSLLATKENNFNLNALLYLALSEYQLGEREKSLQTAQKLYTSDPSQKNKRLYLLIKENKLLSISDPAYGQIFFDSER